MPHRIKKTNEIAVFVDFDNTITTLDIGDEIFKVFGEFEPHHSRFLNREIRIDEYWRTVAGSLREGVGENTLAEFAKSCEIDVNFAKFAYYCRDLSIPITILSDGFDVYIHPILKKEKLDWIKVICNRLIFNSNGKAELDFPFASESCNCQCASCKRNAMLAITPPETATIFIGDGYSDFCAALHSDIIFAKKKLAVWCNENRVPHYPYSNFFDVFVQFRRIIEQGKIKPRNQAQLLRKKAFEIE